MDRAIQRTDDDALQSKLAASLKGYFHDEFLPKFCQKPPAPRLPLINIGTYCRVVGIQQIIDKFLALTKNSTRRNIVSVGAGSDTRAFHLLQANGLNLDYYELDFPVKIQKKQQIIMHDERLRQIVDEHREHYNLIGCDLRDIEACSSQFERLKDPVPTLILSECCLCYLNPEKSDNVLKFFRSIVPTKFLSAALYEPISLEDEFGRVMAENLAMRGLSLPTIDLYSTLASQVSRLVEIIGGEPQAVDIETVHTKWIPAVDLQRIAKLEFLDEVEEMHLLMRHYCIAWVFGA